MAQSVSRGRLKVEMEDRVNYRPICETRQVGIILGPLLRCQHCYSYLRCTLQLGGFPLANDIHHPLLKALNRRAVSLEDCWKSGPLCWVCKVCNTGLGTGDWELFFSSSFKSNQLRRGASYQHYQVDFQRNKSSSAILYTANGKNAEQKAHSMPIQPSVCV